MINTRIDTAALPALAAEVAAALSDDWTLLPAEEELARREVTIRHASGQEIRFALKDNNRRIELRGLFGFKLHQYVDFKHPGASSIGVASTKTPAQIAGELKRRLIPAYTEAFNLTHAAHAREVARAASDFAIATELATLAGTKVSGRHGAKPSADNLNAEPVVWIGGTIATVSHGRITFERVTVGPAVAKLIVAALNKEPK